MKQRFRVLIVDDHAHAREGIRTILEEDDAFEVVGEAQNGKEAIQLTGTMRPDLILMDISMKEMGGLEATKMIKAKYPHIKIVMVTVSDDIADLFEAIKKGAQGYLLKQISPSTWHEYLKAILYDEAPMSREFAVRLLKEFSAKNKTAPKPLQDPLTGREREILEWVAKGVTNREIAEKLRISEHTVKNHLKNILSKLHLENRVQLTRYAYEQGWMDS